MVDSPRASITGDLDEIFTIIDSVIEVDTEYFSRGIYECEVCVGTDEINCTGSNTTIATVGRPPIIDTGTEGGELFLVLYVCCAFAFIPRGFHVHILRLELCLHWWFYYPGLLLTC